jgi:lysophospholipase L1-like esterase
LSGRARSVVGVLQRSPLGGAYTALIVCTVLALPAAGLGQPESPGPADVARPREDRLSQAAHRELLEKAKSGHIDVYFAGDSIFRRWGATDYPELLANWRQNFFGWNAADFAWGADRTEHILWRLENGELDGVNPKVIVLLAGTNNVGNEPPAEGVERKAQDVARGIRAILDVMRQKAPDATIILTAILPRNDNIDVMPTIARINEIIAGFADGERIRFVNVNAQLADARSELVNGVMNDDKLHPSIEGYQILADALKPILREALGPPGKEDHAPPPTGIPDVDD